MVRILPCHHFQGQKIGKCEDAIGICLAGNFLIVGLEHQINIYLDGPPPPPENVDIEAGTAAEAREIGVPFKYKRITSIPSESTTPADESESKELTLFNRFSTVDPLHALSYNEKGHYILTLEKRDNGSEKPTSIVRAYFQWEHKENDKPMRARIAGLVSPTGSHSEDGSGESLMMVEIPIPTANAPVQALASCKLTGHLAICSDSYINIYTFRMKEGSGRIKFYGDFDHIYTVELAGSFKPTKIIFLSNYICTMNIEKCLVFKITKLEYASDQSTNINSNNPSTNNTTTTKDSPPEPIPLPVPIPVAKRISYDKVKYDPKSETVQTVYLNSIVKANRKYEIVNTGISEEIQGEIRGNSKLIVPNSTEEIIIQDLVRISCTETNSSSDAIVISRFVDAGLFPIRIKDELGGVAFVIGTASEAFVYHLPTVKTNPLVSRVIYFPFTSPLLSFSYDNLFLHALTETGLETYTTRFLYNPLKDIEGFFKYLNDCPFQPNKRNDQPCLIGIRPFLGVKYMTSNEQLISILASPTSAKKSTNNEENLCTIYSLHLPDLDALYEDFYKSAQSLVTSSPETYLILNSELHLILRTFTHNHPGKSQGFILKYFEVLRNMGLQLFRDYDKNDPTTHEYLEKGATFLIMAHCDLTFFFSTENSESYTKDETLIPGFVRLIKILLPKQIQSSKMSPNLARQLIEFLATNDPEELASILIDTPLLREIATSRLIEILTDIAEKNDYPKEIILALLLVFMALSGGEKASRSQVKDLISKCNLSKLDEILDLKFLIEQKSSHLTDLSICLSTLKSNLIIKKFSSAVKRNELNLDEIMIGFVQGVNLNSDPEVQQSLTRILSYILEEYFQDKLIVKHEISCNFPAPFLLDEEIRAIHCLVRGYLSHIRILTVQEPDIASLNGSSMMSESFPEENESMESVEMDQSNDRPGQLEITSFNIRNQVFGKIPSFVLAVVRDILNEKSDSKSTKSSLSFAFNEGLDCFAKLTSVLSSNLVNVKGVRELVQEFVSTGKNTDGPIHHSLQLLIDPIDKTINNLILKHPTVIMLFAKEMLGKSTDKWKCLVEKLKEKILEENSEDVEVFSTIIESVYLHLANVLSPSELEKVLERGEESYKYHEVCERIDLANTYSNLVINMSNEYLKH